MAICGRYASVTNRCEGFYVLLECHRMCCFFIFCSSNHCSDTVNAVIGGAEDKKQHMDISGQCVCVRVGLLFIFLAPSMCACWNK